MVADRVTSPCPHALIGSMPKVKTDNQGRLVLTEEFLRMLGTEPIVCGLPLGAGHHPVSLR